jgi:hypothetical protein
MEKGFYRVARRVFYSFHYQPDSWRAAMVRNIGSIEGNTPASANAWEEVKRGGNAAIKRWIDSQMNDRSCTVVLVGSDTANRKWINYEIVKSWNDGMGVAGIHIHGLENMNGQTSRKGNNPFSCILPNASNRPLSSIVKCHDPAGRSSEERYDWISRHLADAIEEAIRIRNQH